MFPRRCFMIFSGLALATFASAAAKPLVIDPAQTRIDVIVKATVDSFTGKLQDCAPVITVGDDGHIATARVGFRFMDVLTGKPKRDRAMHEWQNTERFPDGEFVLEALQSAPDGAMQAKGSLTFHGVTRPITFPVSVTRENSTYAIEGDAAIDVRDYDLPVIKMFAVLKVDPIVRVKFHLQGHVAP